MRGILGRSNSTTTGSAGLFLELFHKRKMCARVWAVHTAKSEIVLDATMKVLLLSKYRHLELTNFPDPTPGPGEILVRVAACGICGSDVHGYDGSSGRRIPPIVMGHEAAGTIDAIGDGVHDYAVGDRVTFDSTIYCGKCPYCLRGQANLCDNRQVLGVSTEEYRRAGAFAEFVLVPER